MNQVKGLYEVIDKGKNIDINFSRQLVQRKNPIFQLSLRLLNGKPRKKRIIGLTMLSFHHAWEASRYGKYGNQLFPADIGDIKIIF